jgi:DNA polymerase-1
MNRKRISHKLGDVVGRELGMGLSKEEQRADWAGELTPGMLRYAQNDSAVLLLLAGILGSGIEGAGLGRTMEIEHRALPAITRMANAGVPLDAEGWGERLARIEDEKARLKQRLEELAPDHPDGGSWNWNSAQQIKEAFALLGIVLSDTKGETLSRCAHPLAKDLLEYRKAAKLLSTYGEKLLEKVEADGRIRGSWWQIGAGTGRMACSNQNLQNFPPEVRRYVRAPEGRALVIADYSQIELRIAAKISGDERMLGAFGEGLDVHEITARSLTGREVVSKEERQLAKAVNFGLLYGMSPGGLRAYARASYGVEMTREEAERYWRDFFETYLGIRAWHDREYRELKKRGSVETRTLTGRRRTSVTEFTERLNSPVQGTGADGLKLALALLHERRNVCPDAVPILAVHDEIVVECEEADAQKVEAWLERAMIDGMDEVLNGPVAEGPRVPVEVEARNAETWAG